MTIARPVLDVRGEAAKLPAFLRRDLLLALSYRMAFVSDIVMLVVQALIFSFVSQLVDPGKLPAYGGSRASYLSFVMVGIVFGAFLQVGLARVSVAIRSEQLMGTLDSLFMTPTSPVTLQAGFVVYDLVYVPVRTLLFLLIVTAWFGAGLELGQVGPALALLVGFVPFVWGLGVASAAATLTFRRGTRVLGMGSLALTLSSGAYFPLTLLPGWLRPVAEANPMAIALQGAREALLGGAGWDAALGRLVVIAPASALSLVLGLLAFSAALRRERRLGTLGLY